MVFALFLILAGCSSGSAVIAGMQQVSGISLTRTWGLNRSLTVKRRRPTPRSDWPASRSTWRLMWMSVIITGGSWPKYGWRSRKTTERLKVRAKKYNAELLLNGYAQVMTIPPNVKYTLSYCQPPKGSPGGGQRPLECGHNRARSCTSFWQ